MKRLAFVVAVSFLTGCPDTGVVCRAGTSRCGNGCADFTSDSRNCGGCGQACAASQVCVNSACACRPGTSECKGLCVVYDSDPKNCGGCGEACDPGQFCNQRTCV